MATFRIGLFGAVIKDTHFLSNTGLKAILFCYRNLNGIEAIWKMVCVFPLQPGS